MTKFACLFPGQGSQSCRMGHDLFSKFAHARKAFEQIDELTCLTPSLCQLCFEGSAESLKQTINTQPTILAVSIVAWQCFKAEGGPKPAYVAGHSLGEFSALYASSVVTLEAVLKLVRERAALMESCPEGAMSAVLGMKFDALNQLCAKHSQSGTDKVAVVANINTAEQLVISGNPTVVAAVASEAKASGGKVIPLPVGGAFHSPLMLDASAKFNKLIDQVTFGEAANPIVQNYSAEATSQPEVLKENLRKQMGSPVKWCQSIEYMLNQGVTHFVEIGPGKVLSGMVKKINRQAKVCNIEDSESLTQALEFLQSPAIV